MASVACAVGVSCSSVSNVTKCPLDEIVASPEFQLTPWAFPGLLREAIVVTPVLMLRTKTSPSPPFVSEATRFDEPLSKTTNCPEAEMEGVKLQLFPTPAPVLTLTSVDTPVVLSKRNTSGEPFVSPPPRLG